MARVKRYMTLDGGPDKWTAKFGSDARHTEAVSVEVVLGKNGPIVAGITVSDTNGVSPREVKRLPLATYIQAAVAAASDASRWEDRRFRQRLGQILNAPKGRPERGRSTGFYQDLAKSYRSLMVNGVPHPAKEIARRKGVDLNTVHQWVFRARKLGFLERPMNPKRRKR